MQTPEAMNDMQLLALGNYAPEASEHIMQLRDILRAAWMIVKASGNDLVLRRSDIEEYPGDDRARIETVKDDKTGDITFTAITLT